MWLLFRRPSSWTEHERTNGVSDVLTRFSLTMPSLAAKNANTWEMKYFSSSFRDSQCCRSLDRSTWTHTHTTTSLHWAEFVSRVSERRRHVYLLGRPERRLGLLVHLPDVVVLDGEDDEATRVFFQQRLLLAAAALRHFGLKNHKRPETQRSIFPSINLTTLNVLLDVSQSLVLFVISKAADKLCFFSISD